MSVGKVHVLFLAEELRTGGAETYFYKLEELIDRNLISFHSAGVPSGNEERLCFPELFVPYSFSIWDRIRVVGKYVCSHDVDIVHANSLQLCFAAAAARRIVHKPFKIVYTKHNLTRLEKLAPATLTAFVNRYVDALVAICETDERVLADRGVRGDLLFRINNGVDLNSFPFALRFPLEKNAKLRIGILARLSSEKRHDLFLEFAKEFHGLFPNSAFYIGGDGPNFNSIKNYVNSNLMNEYVTMTGRVDAASFLSGIDVLTLLSDREVMPMSILEGMASGCAVIARSVGGMRDVVRPETGVLVEGDCPSDYARSLIAAYFAHEFEQKTKRARKLIEKDYSLDKALRKHEELYIRLAQSAGE